MQKLQWHTEKRIVDTLIPNAAAPRTISKKQLTALKKSLTTMGLVEIPALDLDNSVLAGSQRIKVLQLMGKGQTEIDVRIPNRKLTDEERDRYMIGSNSISGDWDYAKLKDFDLDLLLDVGFDKDELNKIWQKDAETEDDDFDVEAELKKIKEPTTKLGDLVILGEHRLCCGDSTDPNVLQRLFGNEKAAVIYSDPVYNLNIQYARGIGGTRDFGGNVNDNRSYEEYVEFLRKSIACALEVSEKDCHLFYWNDQSQIGILQQLYRDLGIENKRVCLWIKNGFSCTPGVAFHKSYEPCIYGVRGRPYLSKDVANLNEVANKDMTNGNDLLDQIDIWMHKRLPSNQYEHSTQKPPTLHEKAFKRCSKPGDIILDSFCGSGSSMIAAQQLGRRLYGVELEPQFCDVIIRRFERLTGIKARVISNEETS